MPVEATATDGTTDPRSKKPAAKDVSLKKVNWKADWKPEKQKDPLELCSHGVVLPAFTIRAEKVTAKSGTVRENKCIEVNCHRCAKEADILGVK